MSGDPAAGYLGRLVTRMTDEPAIRPRVASRFEVAGGGHRDVEPTTAGRATPLVVPGRPWSDPRLPFALERADGPTANEQAVADPPRDLATLVRRLTKGPDTGNAEPHAAREGTVHEAVRASSDRAHASGSSGSSGSVDATEPEPGLIRAVVRAVGPGPFADASPHDAIRVAAAVAAADSNGRGEGREPDVVQVHIGRVEVRAITAAAPAPAPAGRPSAGARPLSLERYLAGERRS